MFNVCVEYIYIVCVFFCLNDRAVRVCARSMYAIYVLVQEYMCVCEYACVCA